MAPVDGLRVTALASGSAGNSVLVESPGARILIDAGLAADDLEARLVSIGVRPGALDGVVLTHRHWDHVRGVTDFCRAHRVRVHATRRTASALGSQVHRLLRRFDPHEAFAIGDLAVHPVPVEHDAPQTVALVVTCGGVRYAHVTDLGSFDAALCEPLERCHGLYLEFNHEPALLEAGADPPHLKRRIASARGHLSNPRAAELLAALAHDGLQCVWLAHLSQRNNTPALALDAARRALGDCGARLVVAAQDRPGDAVVLGGGSVRSLSGT